jgi:hypothetical protein
MCPRKQIKQEKKLPDKYIIPNPYDIPIHDQGNKNNCTSHAVAAGFEYKLSDLLKERALIDVDDLWDKQLKYGTATEEEGDTVEDALKIAFEYGMLFTTESGKKGIFKPNKGITMIN